jgi:hypothetical protein
VCIPSGIGFTAMLPPLQLGLRALAKLIGPREKKFGKSLRTDLAPALVESP